MKSKFTYIACITIVMLAAHSTQLSAQSTNKEIGLRLGASGSSFVFKKEKQPNKFRRYRAGINNLGLVGSDNFVASITLAVAMEKRKSVDENLWFIHGLEPRIGGAGTPGNSFLTIGIGYILGFQYDLSDSFSINAEIIPSVSTLFNNSGGDSLFVDASPNSSAGISVVYRFQKN